MADSWIKMRVGLRRHPKVVRIVSALKADRLRVVGALHAIWSVFDEHSVDGVLPGYSFEMMDEEIAWPGFSTAMEGVNWLARDGDCGLVMPEFQTHNSAPAKRRAQESDRKREVREADRKASADEADKKRTRVKGKKNSPSQGSGETTRATRLPADWLLPKAWGEWALQERKTWDAERVRQVATIFRNHWIAKSGKDAAKLDWQATWHNWVLKEGERPINGKDVAPTRWKAGAEPDEVIIRVAAELQLKPWDRDGGETHGQFRARIVDAGGEGLLKARPA